MDAAYPWLKAAHIVSVVAWMSGLFYLPRLYAYHSKVAAGSDPDLLFRTMERKLMHVITVPAAALTWVFGILLLIATGYGTTGWFQAKILFVLAMTAFNFAAERWRRDLAAGRNRHTERFYRMANEVPTGLLIVIVVLVVVKPF